VYVSRMNCYNSPFLDRIERSVEVMVSSGLIVNGSFLDLWHRLSQLYMYLDDIGVCIYGDCEATAPLVLLFNYTHRFEWVVVNG
jgi:hypothetical protein